ncbi:MAG: pyridoxamine 5'-phosphate oxidase family protein, partial [Desulfomonilaceae bacterium]
MRRKKCEITDIKEIERILGSVVIGRIATYGSDGYPYVTPVNFVLYRGNIYFHSAPEGEKLDNLNRNPNVCFEVDIPLAYLNSGFDPNSRICQLHQLYHCVIIRGKATVVQDDALKVECLNALVSKHEGNSAHGQV